MASEVFDLDAVAAEVVKEPMPFTWEGQQWTLAHMTGVDWRVMEMATAGDIEAMQKAFRYAMGPEQAKRFDKVPQPLAPMKELFKRWLRHNGSSEGESSASPDSSASTAGPSKPPSNSTTDSTSVDSSPAS